MSLFADHSAFDPDRDSKMPVRRGPVWILLRAIHVLGSLSFSRHPLDAWIWLRSMRARRRPLSMAIPWLTFAAVRAIRAQLPIQPHVFEFGSGHSTLYWLDLGATLTSIEDDAQWHQILSKSLRSHGYGNYTLVFAESKIDYVSSIESKPLSSQDLVLVDGAHRRECVQIAVQYVKPGGMLVVDNTDWHWFKDAPLEGIPANWQREDYPGFGPMLGHKSQTTVWVRPS